MAEPPWTDNEPTTRLRSMTSLEVPVRIEGEALHAGAGEIPGRPGGGITKRGDQCHGRASPLQTDLAVLGVLLVCKVIGVIRVVDRDAAARRIAVRVVSVLCQDLRRSDS